MLFILLQTAETIQAISSLFSNFQGWGGVGAVIVVVAAMPAAAVIGLALINSRSQSRLIDVLEKNTAAALKTAEAAAANAAGIDELKDGHRELAAKLNTIDRNVGLTLEHARQHRSPAAGGGK